MRLHTCHRVGRRGSGHICGCIPAIGLGEEEVATFAVAYLLGHAIGLGEEESGHFICYVSGNRKWQKRQDRLGPLANVCFSDTSQRKRFGFSILCSVRNPSTLKALEHTLY